MPSIFYLVLELQTLTSNHNQMARTTVPEQVGHARPFDTLPIEIFVRILLEEVCRSWPLREVFDGVRTPRLPSQSPLPSLRSVSRFWKQAIDDSPELWTQISSDYPLPAIATFLQKSSSRLLDIDVIIRPQNNVVNDDDTDADSDSIRSIPDNHAESAVRLLIPHIIRARILTAYSENSFIATYEDLVNCSAPLLELCSLESYAGPVIRPVDSIVNMGASLSHLRQLQLRNVELLNLQSITAGSLPRLTSLIVGWGMGMDSDDDFRNLLKACPNLRKLSIGPNRGSWSMPEETSGHFYAPQLQSLAVHMTEVRAATLLRTLSAPVTELLVECSEYRNRNGPLVDAFASYVKAASSRPRVAIIGLVTAHNGQPLKGVITLGRYTYRCNPPLWWVAETRRTRIGSAVMQVVQALALDLQVTELRLQLSWDQGGLLRQLSNTFPGTESITVEVCSSALEVLTSLLKDLGDGSHLHFKNLKRLVFEQEGRDYIAPGQSLLELAKIRFELSAPLKYLEAKGSYAPKSRIEDIQRLIPGLVVNFF